MPSEKVGDHVSTLTAAQASFERTPTACLSRRHIFRGIYRRGDVYYGSAQQHKAFPLTKSKDKPEAPSGQVSAANLASRS